MISRIDGLFVWWLITAFAHNIFELICGDAEEEEIWKCADFVAVDYYPSGFLIVRMCLAYTSTFDILQITRLMHIAIHYQSNWLRMTWTHSEYIKLTILHKHGSEWEEKKPIARCRKRNVERNFLNRSDVNGFIVRSLEPRSNVCTAMLLFVCKCSWKTKEMKCPERNVEII